MKKVGICIAFIALLLACVALICYFVFPECFNNSGHITSEDCVTLYQANEPSFQEASATLTRNYAKGLAVVRNVDALESRVKHKINDLYILSNQPLEADAYEAIYQSVAPLFNQNNIERIGVSEDSIGFILTHEYGTIVGIYYISTGDFPNNGYQTILERKRINENWFVMIVQD